MSLALLALLLISCGQVETDKPKVDSPVLRAEVERVEPLLAWTCGGRIPARRYDFPCVKEGDGVSMLGRWIIDTGDTDRFSAIIDSIGPDGRLWRNPERVNNDDDNSSSRDQLLGLLEATVATRDRTGLLAVMRYVSSTGSLCPGDDRCRVTPSIRTAVKDVLDEKVGTAERALDVETVYMEAETAPPTYRAYLVARKLMLHIRTGTMNVGYARAAKRLAERFPNSLFIEVVDKVSNDGSLKHVTRELTKCLASWQRPGPDWWGNAIERHCTDSMQGHELVALGKYLLR